MLSWLVAGRDPESATQFMCDVSERLASRVQLTTDGYTAYADAVQTAFLGDVDYAQLVKSFKSSEDKPSIYKQPITGDPIAKYISTSIVERQNLNIRMGQRRYTRLTNAFSKKVRNQAASLAIYFFYYNFCRPHHALANPYRRTPAMAAGVDTRKRSLRYLVELVDKATPPPNRPKQYKSEKRRIRYLPKLGR